MPLQTTEGVIKQRERQGGKEVLGPDILEHAQRTVMYECAILQDCQLLLLPLLQVPDRALGEFGRDRGEVLCRLFFRFFRSS